MLADTTRLDFQPHLPLLTCYLPCTEMGGAVTPGAKVCACGEVAVLYRNLLRQSLPAAPYSGTEQRLSYFLGKL